MDLNWTGIVCDIIAFVITVLFSYVWKKWVQPWLEQNNLNQAAVIAVKAAEALYGRYNGSEKMKYAIYCIRNKGINLDEQIVVEAIQAAWTDLNLAQIAAGVKNVEEKEQ